MSCMPSFIETLATIVQAGWLAACSGNHRKMDDVDFGWNSSGKLFQRHAVPKRCVSGLLAAAADTAEPERKGHPCPVRAQRSHGGIAGGLGLLQQLHAWGVGVAAEVNTFYLLERSMS